MLELSKMVVFQTSQWVITASSLAESCGRKWGLRWGYKLEVEQEIVNVVKSSPKWVPGPFLLPKVALHASLSFLVADYQRLPWPTPFFGIHIPTYSTAHSCIHMHNANHQWSFHCSKLKKSYWVLSVVVSGLFPSWRLFINFKLCLYFYVSHILLTSYF